MTHLLFCLLWITNPTTMTSVNSRHNDHYSYYHRGSSQDVQPPTEGGFVLMGGGGDVDEAFEWMAERGGNGDFLVLRGSGADGYQQYLDELTEANSVSTLVIKDAAAASDPFVLERVAQAEAIFMAGGDQWNYVGKWKNSPLLDALNGAILKGVPIGGTSAGLAVLGEHLFSAEKNTVTSEQALADPYHDHITLASDFLHAPPLRGLITDSHFSERDRMGRLVTFMGRLHDDSGLSQMRGVGVDEATAALVTPDGQARVVGQGEVHWVKSSAPPETCQVGLPLTFTGLEVTSTAAGQTFDLQRFESPESPAYELSVRDGQLVYGAR